LSVGAAQLYTIVFAAKQPEIYRNNITYLAGTLTVAVEMMKPTVATHIGIEM